MLRVRVAVLALALGMLGSAAGSPQDLPEVPPDVSPYDPSAPVIEKVLKTGLLRTREGRFWGGTKVNRYELSRVVAKLLLIGGAPGTAGPGAAAPEFTDVPADHPERQEIAASVHSGILQGYEGKFHGDKLVNRYQVAVVVKRLAEKLGLALAPTTLTFADVPASHWAFSSVELTCSAGLVQPLLDGSFHGDKLVDRLQLAGIVYRTATRLGWKHLPPPEPPTAVPPARELELLEGELLGLHRDVERLKAKIAEVRTKLQGK